MSDLPEREEIEWVFGLTGGELADEPWAGHRYWYEGIPEYAHDDFPPHAEAWGDYRTIVMQALYSPPPERIADPATGDVWILDKTYSSSGEAELPDPPGETIYIGDGWVEAVYRDSRGIHAEAIAKALDVNPILGQQIEKVLYGVRDSRAESVEQALDLINTAIDAHGVEVVRGPYFRRASRWGDIVAAYVNRGDTYDMTVLYDVGRNKILITSMGDWVVQYEAEHGEPK